MYLILRLLDTALLVFSYLVLARCILSFLVHPRTDNKLVQFVYEVTEPVMAYFRKLLPPSNGIDFSPIILLLAISLLRSII